MNESPEQQEASKKRIKLGWPYLLILVAVFVAFAVMNLRGVPGDREMDFSSTPPIKLAKNFDHGWPMKWMQSEAMVKAGTRGYPKMGSSWAGIGTTVSLNLSYLFVNVVLGLVLLFIVWMVCAYHAKRYQGMRFGLLGILVLMSIVSVAVAHYQYHRKVHMAEQASPLSLDAINSSALKRWFGPKWLVALLGQQQWMEVYSHRSQLICYSAKLDATQAEELVHFPFVQGVSVFGDLPNEQIEALGRLPGLKNVAVRCKMRDSLYSLPSRGSRGITHNLQAIVGERFESEVSTFEVPLLNEPQGPDVVLPHVSELSISSLSFNSYQVPNAIDLISCCPKLSKVTISGINFLPEDVAGLPDSIEEINIEFPLSSSDRKEIEERYSHARVRVKKPVLDYEDPESWLPWKQALIRVARRRNASSLPTKLSVGTLDLSRAKLDVEFLEKFEQVFPGVETLIFGDFDTNETTLWLMSQCPKLKSIDASYASLGFEDAILFPPSIESLRICQGEITVGQFQQLIRRLGLRELAIVSCDFSGSEISEISSTDTGCKVVIR